MMAKPGIPAESSPVEAPVAEDGIDDINGIDDIDETDALADLAAFDEDDDIFADLDDLDVAESDGAASADAEAESAEFIDEPETARLSRA
ncbi:hypothetical protein P4S72_03900 [Vibrio sp. PP-XX7]